MATIEQIKNKVREFQLRTNFGRTDEDNFAPWWLQQKFKLSDEDATMYSSDGSYDFGIDGYFIQSSFEKTTISLLQAKYSEDLSQIRKGVNDITRFLPELAKIINGIESDNFKENIVVKGIRRRIANLEISEKTPLEIDAYIISLNNLSNEIVENKTETQQRDLIKTFEKEFNNSNIILSIKLLGLDSLIEKNTSTIYRQSKPFNISFDGSDEVDMDDSRFISGLGKLSDMVNLYIMKGNQLFDKNVRLFLYGKKNESRGPAGKIRETLENINEGKWKPEKLAFLHNGITIYSTNIILDKEKKQLEITNPSILNGCQTIKSSYFFYEDRMSKQKINKEIWESIPVSIRVVATKDDKLWREIAEANNRQNSMSASALRSNDEVQIRLENIFKDKKIFYERQEASFENVTRTETDFESVYSNSLKEPIYIETLAQTIVCVSELPLSYAIRHAEIFESEKMYERVFSKKNLKNIEFLIFAYNVRRLVELAVKKAIPENTQKYADFRPTKYRELLTRLIVKVIFKRKKVELIEEYNKQVLSSRGSEAANLQEHLRQLLKSIDFPILKLIGEIYYGFDGKDPNEKWLKQDNQELLAKISSKLKIDQINVFDLIEEELE